LNKGEVSMKILFVTTIDLQIKTFHWRTIQLLAEKGNIVDVATSGPETWKGVHQKYQVPFRRNPLNPNNLKARNELRKILQENQYDIISCHSPSGGFFGRWAAKGLPVHVIYTAHGFHFWKGAPFINRVVYRNMEKLAAHWTDTLVTINPEDYRAAQQFHYKPNGKAVYIPGVGVDVKDIQAQKSDPSEIRKKLNLPEDAFVIGSIGELIKRKNHRFVLETLQDAFHQDPKLHYVICGSGALTEELQEEIHSLHLANQVHLLGFREDARALLYGMDLFVFPSLQEGLPVAVMEAMAAGLPVLASDIRGCHDLIHDGVNGMLYPSNNAGIFLQKYQTLRTDAAFREKLGKQAEKDAWQYSIEEVEPQILALYQEKNKQGG
jgi:glycosyltransferase involved in cell wall biosynthesis